MFLLAEPVVKLRKACSARVPHSRLVNHDHTTLGISQGQSEMLVLLCPVKLSK